MSLAFSHFGLAICVACVADHGAIAAAADLQCPAQIAGGPVQVPGASTDWVAFAPVPLKLHSVGFMDGPPSRKIELMPAKIDQHRDRSTVTWQFADGPLKNGKWLSCGYGDGGEITLSKPISDSTATCIVYYRNGVLPNFRDIRIECR
ncbi:MAG: STY0301 family protein [Pseudomonadota bacterium]